MRYDFHPFHRPAAGNNLNDASSLLTIPELSDGFDSSLEGPEGGLFPVSYFSEPVPSGTYAVHITLEAPADFPQIFLFTGRKQLRDIISLKKGERYEKTFYQSAAEIMPRYHQHVYPVRHLFATCCARELNAMPGIPIAPGFAGPAPAVPVISGFAGPAPAVPVISGFAGLAPAVPVISGFAEPIPDIPVVYLCGDSTVTDQSSEIPYHPGACYSSWGQALPAFLDGRIAVENQAHCGLTTETFRTEGHMEIVKKYIRPGDFCLIQFGHNDQKLPHLLADREYPVNLKRYIREVRDAGAIPVLVTSPGRNIWKPDGSYHDLLAEHTAAVKKVAEENKTALIDLHEFTVNKIISDGQEVSRGYFHPGDYTHTNEYGAVQSAAYIAGRLHRLYPETFSRINTFPPFTPPPHLWDTLSKSSGRTKGAGQKEQFDAAEKSVSALLEAMQTASRKAFRRGVL